MNPWIEIGLSNAAVATVLAVIAAAVSRWGKRPTLAHALWVLVLVKLITPSFVSIPVWRQVAESPATTNQRASNVDSNHSIDSRRESVAPSRFREWLSRDDRDSQSAAIDRTENLKDLEVESDSQVLDDPFVDDAEEWMPAVAMPIAIDRSSTADLPSRSSIGSWITALLIGIWVIGAIVYFARMARRLVRFRRLLQLADDPQPELHAFVDRLSQQIGLTRTPRVVMVPGTVSPMVLAAGRNSLLILPRDLVGYLADERQLATLIAHELAHLRRGDHWIRRLELVVSGLYWWLPTVWLTRRGLREVEEEICDAWVVKTIPAANRSYAEALLNTVDFLSGAKPLASPASSTIGHFRFIKRRIVMIMKGSVSTRLAWSGRFMVLLLAAAILPLSFGSTTAVAVDETDEPTIAQPSDDPPEFAFIEQRRDDDDDDDDDDERRRDRRRSRDDDDDDDFDVDDIRAEVLEELKSEFAEVNDEIAEAMEEVREELTEELREAPPEVQKIISQIDIDALLDDILEDAPKPVRTFVDEVDIQGIIDEALSDADLDDIEFDDAQAKALQALLMREVSGELKNALGEMSGELRRVQEEVRRAMRTAPPEIRAMLEEVDIDELLDEVLEGSLPIVRQMVDEMEIEEIVEEALHGRRDRDDDDDARDDDARDDDARDDDEDEDERRAERRDRGDRDDVEARLERRLEQLLKEAEAIRRELRELRREGGGR